MHRCLCALREQKNKGVVKVHVHVRLFSLPPISDFTKAIISEIRAKDVGNLMQICGTVVRTGTVRMLELSKEYQCQNPRCSYRFRVYADPEQDNLLPQPRSCPADKVRRLSAAPDGDMGDGSNGDIGGVNDQKNEKKKCSSSNLREVEGSNICVDYQEIKIQGANFRMTPHTTLCSLPILYTCQQIRSSDWRWAVSRGRSWSSWRRIWWTSIMRAMT